MRKAQYRRNPDDNPCTTPTTTIASEYTRIAWLLPGRIPLSIAPAASSGTEIFAAVQETQASTPNASVGRWEASVPRISRQPARRVSPSRSTSAPSARRAPRLAAPASAGCRSRLPAGFRDPRCDCETVVVEATHRAPRVSWRVVAVVAVALVYSWIASGLRPFTHPEAFAVGVPIVAAGIATLRSARRAGQAAAPESRRGVLVWRGLLAAFLIWELISYRSSPREDFPTFSSVTDTIMSTHPGRFALFAIWLAIGYGIFRR